MKQHNDGYTPLTKADIKRLPEDVVVVHKKYKLPVLRDKPRHDGAACVALSGRIGVRVSCTLYTIRPRFCREFEPGSHACHTARRRAGLT